MNAACGPEHRDEIAELIACFVVEVPDPGIHKVRPTQVAH
jgi:hypothetical protein